MKVSYLRWAMSLWSQRADLGRAEPWLRSIAVAIWAFVGLAHWQWGEPLPAWVWPWLAFGAAFGLTSAHRRLPRWGSAAALAVQTLAALSLPHFGLPGSEGLLLAVVAAQAPTVLPVRAAVTWALAQVVPLVAVVWAAQRPGEIAEVGGAYSTVSAVALRVDGLPPSARAGGRALAEANVEILGARSLVMEGVRQGERLRISRELHDSLGHQLTALRLQLELAGRHADVSASHEALAKARAISKEAIADLRRAVSEVHTDAGIDFPTALRALAAGLPGTDIHIEAPEGFALAGEVGHVLFRCVQEAVTNSLKHSDGHRIWIALAQGNEGIEVRVRDDGRGDRGFAPGFGLKGIAARAAQLGGRAESGPVPGAGFQVHVVVPRERP